MSESVRELLTLVLVRRDEEVLLGIKKTGFGSGRYNAYGGKIESGEAPLQGALRELQEESGLLAKEAVEVARIEVDYEQTKKRVLLHVFEVRKFLGEVLPSEELEGHWLPVSEVPYAQMWATDQYWLPFVLNGKKMKAYFRLRTDEAIIFQSVEEVMSFDE